MNDCGKSSRLSELWLLGKHQRTQHIVMLNIDVFTKRSQTRGKVQGLESRESQEQALGVPVKLLSCPTLWSHWLQPTRLLHPWNFPGKSTGVGCHCLLRRAMHRRWLIKILEGAGLWMPTWSKVAINLLCWLQTVIWEISSWINFGSLYKQPSFCLHLSYCK